MSKGIVVKKVKELMDAYNTQDLSKVSGESEQRGDMI